MLDKLKAHFKNRFPKNSNAPRVFFSPGRINVIGEHVDYCGGNVLPAAISFGTFAVAAERGDDVFNLYSLNFKNGLSQDLGALEKVKEPAWVNYPLGVLKYLQDRGLKARGLDVLLWGNLPQGAGLSSSASLEVLIGTMLQEMFDLEMPRVELVALCQKVENEWVGVQCGIMDQFAVGMAKSGHAMLLNCDSLKHKHIPFGSDQLSFLIVNSNKPRSLSDSEFNERRSTCESAVRKLQTMYPKIKYLSELGLSDLDGGFSILNDIERKRVNHVVTECSRVKETVKSLTAGDYFAVGKALYSSHQSLKMDYNVSCPELDCIVDTAKTIPGVLGARLTGAGFGGCAIALMEKEAEDGFTQKLSRVYSQETGLKASFYPVTFEEGSRELNQEPSKESKYVSH